MNVHVSYKVHKTPDIEKEIGHQIAVHDGTKRSEFTVSLFKGASHSFPPFPVALPKELTQDSEYYK